MTVNPVPRVGLRLPFSGEPAMMRRIGATARAAEETGFSSVWVGEHLAMPDTIASSYPNSADGTFGFPPDAGWLDPIASLGWVGASTSSVTLGIGVLVMPLREPFRTAKEVASLDVLSGGRVVAAVGLGWMREEFELLGRDFDTRAARAEEAVAVMRALWTDDGVRAEGGGPLMRSRPLPSRPVPILWGGRRPGTLRRVARLGDGWMPSGIGVDELRTSLRELGSHCADYGRDPATVRTVVKLAARVVDRAFLHDMAELGVDELVVEVPWESHRPEEYTDIVAALAQRWGLHTDETGTTL